MNSSTAVNSMSATFDTCVERIANASTERISPLTMGIVIVEICLVLVLASSNMLVVIAVVRFHELRTSTYTFVFSLTISDLMVALVAIPLHISIFLFPAIDGVFVVCMLRYCVLVASYGSSVLTLMLISVDRYIAVEKPYIHHKVLSKTRCRILCVAVWAYSLVCGSLPLMGWHRWSPCVNCLFTLVVPVAFVAFILGHIIIIVFVIGAINLKIFLTANAISRAIRQQIATVTRKPTSHKLFLQNKKAATTLAIVFWTYVICNLPFAIFMLAEVYVLHVSSSGNNSLPSWFYTIRICTTFLSFINSGINPIIYHRRMPEFHKAFRTILRLKSDTRVYPEHS